MLFLPFTAVLEHLPKALLGATVIGAVVGLLDPRPLLRTVRSRPAQGVVAVVTLVLTVALAPRVEIAVLVGAALAVGLELASARPVEVAVQRGSDSVVLRPIGRLWFGSAGRLHRGLLREAGGGEDPRKLEIDVQGLEGLDATGRALLGDVLERVARRGIQFRVLGFEPDEK